MSDLGELYEKGKAQGGMLIFLAGCVTALVAAFRKATKSAPIEDDVDELKKNIASLDGIADELKSTIRKMQREEVARWRELTSVLSGIQNDQTAMQIAQNQDRADANRRWERQLQIISNLDISTRENFQEAIRSLREGHGVGKA